jgi:hypothetical protein
VARAPEQFGGGQCPRKPDFEELAKFAGTELLPPATRQPLNTNMKIYSLIHLSQIANLISFTSQP